ncbi:hypothetical protein [Stenotrophomonas sp. NLF4-10]|uniref:hypothetical protein n=1 Tax=Stenotrophomonas sp. NLF4-10 TaxID=2918754 RepID=UPI001EFBCE6B|nr:hypothetical protein [Stenotrophomonas sp. NLF4-10]MCG8276064.1 hypothetical protein [Stenotrophomonas sp. NLF4-10]
MRKTVRFRLLPLLAVATLMLSASAQAQLRFGSLLDKVGNPAALLQGKGEGVITTSLADAVYADPSRDDVQLPPVQPLASLRTSAQASLLLQPGYYGMQVQSYCLHAGTYGPGGGEGYLYAPPLGKGRELVTAIVRNSVQHPEIEQRDIQLLLWAILARTRLQDMSPQLQRAAASLLSPEQYAAWMRGAAFDMLREKAVQALMQHASPQLRQVLEAEAQLRSMLGSAGGSYAQIEQVAVLAGMAPVGEGSQAVPAGRWSRHPDGYWVRYLPSSYSSTRLEIWVPEDSVAIGREFDPSLHIAVPGNTARQRLIQSAREQH